MKTKAAAGIDIGGTKVAIALETANGERIASRRFPTEPELGPDRIVRNIFTAVRAMLDESGAELAALGIGCPGPIDISRGLVMSPANLRDWVEFPIVELARKQFEVPVALDNDANAAALGEFHFGAGRPFDDVFYMTISTGIGGAIICGGRIHHGVQAGAGEIGHTVVDPNGVACRCGATGCLETIASGTGIARRMRESLAASNGGSVADYQSVTAETVVEGVRAGDPAAARVWDETIRYLAIGLGNAITLVAPEAVVIGGGVATNGELLLHPLRRELRKNVTMLPIDEVEILPAALGADSGVCGALILARGVLKGKEHVV